MKFPLRFLLRLLSVLFAVACAAASSRDLSAADAQKLSKEQVTQIAMDYARKNKLLWDSQSIKDITFNPETKNWLVFFGNGPSGDSYFGLDINDANPEEVALQKRL